MKTIEKMKHRLLAIVLSFVTLITTIFGGGMTVQAADGTITFNGGPYLSYGSYVTAFMTFDGDNVAYCVEPSKKTPEKGSYKYNLLSEDSALRKGLYYLYGGYGYDKVVKEKYFSGWSTEDAYIIGHLALSYIKDGNSSSGDAFYGAPQDYKDKAKSVVKGIQSLPAPPKSFKAWIVPSDDDQTIVGSWYKVPNGYVEIKKSSANTEISKDNSNYSLKGAEYGIYSGSKLVETITTDEKGYAKSGELEEGTYTVKEISASKGYAVDVEGHKVTVTAEETTTLKVTEVPQMNPLDLVLSKVDAETKEGKAQNGLSFENIEFTVKYYDEQSKSDPAEDGAEPVRTWIFKTDAEGKVKFTKDYLVKGDEFYTGTDEKTLCVPLGTVTVQETKAPEGYQLNEKVFVQKITAEGTKETINVYQPVTVEDQIYRGDLKFVKVSDGSLERLANVPFQITSESTGESHVIVTDKNGYADTSASWNPHTRNTNEGKTSSDGVWFGEGKPDNKKGALPYGDYVIEELRCEANTGMNLLKFNVSVYKDGQCVDLGTLTNDKIEICTSAMDEDTESKLSNPDENVTIVDIVEYENLKKGQEYKVVGTLMDKETGKAVLIDGNEVKAETTFKAKKSTGSVEVVFIFNGVSLKGKTVVVFEELYQDDLLLAVHADIEDEDQTIYFPEIGTTAKDAETEDCLSKADEEVTIIDTVAYKNLIPKKEYKVTGILMDKETGKPVEVNGKEVTSEAVFTPETSEGTVEVEFIFDGSALAGKTVVVFETVSYKGREVAVHADIEDEGQTIYFPEIGTTAKDTVTNGNLSHADEEVTIIDTVEFKNLVAGKEYKVTGILMDKETGEVVLVDEKEVTSETVFTPETSEGTVEVAFTFNGSALKGRTIVAFESVSYEENEVAVHADIEDENQTVYFPEIGTTAKDGEDGDQEATADKKVTIVDTVKYENLVKGVEYKVTGVLMDKATGKEFLVEGKPVIAEAEFTAKKENGEVEVTFTFNGEGMEGKDVVVFERLFLVEGELEMQIAEHEDINDEGQTVKLVKEPPVNTPKTGDDSDGYVWVVLVILAGTSFVVQLMRYYKKHEETEE